MAIFHDLHLSKNECSKCKKCPVVVPVSQHLHGVKEWGKEGEREREVNYQWFYNSINYITANKLMLFHSGHNCRQEKKCVYLCVVEDIWVLVIEEILLSGVYLVLLSHCKI